MNSFDIVTEQCAVAQEGSTRDTLEAMQGDKFNSAIRLMKRGKQNRDANSFKEAKSLLKSVRYEISHTRTWPISWAIANSIFGTLYAWGTMQDSIHEDVLYNNKSNEAQMHIYAKLFLNIFSFIPGLGEITSLLEDIRTLYVFFKNKASNRKEPGKIFNRISALMIRVVDLYIESCDLYIADIEDNVDFE